ncbi:methyltransferase, FxLD system [Rhizohabitans arisaemae]|uniref:methyltransferase, FxLD system n=1 Tax=Rhizohabitans arisaemae TaxID=2720610 RepID=UPI0024B1FEDB|nr:methyltransferase, FxLD system [Rhizohabitans arisaemae]
MPADQLAPDDAHEAEHMDPPTRWRQVSLSCGSADTAERVAIAMTDRLIAAEVAGLISAWWFLRKGEAGEILRVRILPAQGKDKQAGTLLEEVATSPQVRHRAVQVYEPETRAFGGDEAMNVVHELFHADSFHLLKHFSHAAEGGQPYLRRELGLILAAQLLRGARQGWYEQGDVWARVAGHRLSTPAARPPAPGSLAANQVQALITASSPAAHSPLAAAPNWSRAFTDTGTALAHLFEQGLLTRGLRAVLAHIILFAWNRAGIPPGEQGLLSATAARVVFASIPDIDLGLTSAPDEVVVATLNAVTTDPEPQSPSPEQLRAALVDSIDRRGTFTSPRIKAAFAAVPRHLFLPGVDLREAYLPQVVRTKHTADGTTISSASHPNLVAAMLGQLDPQPGHHVLEIGAGTGINAALLDLLVGENGSVVTVDIDDDIVAQARSGLAAAGHERVRALVGDGADGYPDGAPYDRIIVTAGAWSIPGPWWEQLGPGGRLVVPMELHDSGLTRSIALDLVAPGRLTSSGKALVCGFVDMRGSTAHERPPVRLADDVVFRGGSAVDDGLKDALTHSAVRKWTGIRVTDEQPAEHLDLWLATSGAPFGRMATGKAARERGLADPARRWAGAALYENGTLAYVAARPAGEDGYELGVTAHGPGAGKLAAQLVELLHQWDHTRPEQPVITAYPVSASAGEPTVGYVINRPDTRFVITW